jgi:hypothetical protein
VPSVLLVSSLLPLVVFFLSFTLMFYSTERAKLRKKTQLRIKMRTSAKLRTTKCISYIYIYIRARRSAALGDEGPGAAARSPALRAGAGAPSHPLIHLSHLISPAQ